LAAGLGLGLRRTSEGVDLTQPADQWVRTGENLVHHIRSHCLPDLLTTAWLRAYLASASMLREGLCSNALILFPTVAAVMFAVGLLAAAGPARRGLAIEPTEALRTE
jgi:hypothetical protein